MHFFISSMSGALAELGAPKIYHFWNALIHCNGKVGSLYSWMLQKILIISKNVSNEICVKLNFLQKTRGSISLSTLEVELGAFKDLCFWNIIQWNLWLYYFTWTEHSHWICIIGVIRLVKDCTLGKLKVTSRVESWLRLNNRFLFWFFFFCTELDFSFFSIFYLFC